MIGTSTSSSEEITGPKRSIPSLDGLRALSVVAVVLGHSQSPFLDRLPFNSVIRNGHQGVSCFFVISGFLITHLLLKEQNRYGSIGLRHFYFRRSFRIFPPFYVFLLVVWCLHLMHYVPLTASALLAAASYTWNYVRVPDTWILGHCWSLSLEEQFYLLWPASMAFFSKRVNAFIAAGVLVVSPFSRVVTYFVWPQMRTHMDMMLHTHLDTIMVGCLLSLIIDLKSFPKGLHLALRRSSLVAALAFLIVVDNYATSRWRGMYLMTIGITLENIALAMVLLFVVFHHMSLPGRLMNLKPLAHLGRISYSLYLWQQFFTGPRTFLFPLNLLAILACAELSYLIIELPSFRVRDYVDARFFKRRRKVEIRAQEQRCI